MLDKMKSRHGTRSSSAARQRVPSSSDSEVRHEQRACALCLNNIDVPIPDHLIDQLVAGKVVLFAGAGISTENAAVYGSTFYDTIRAELRIPGSETPTFPELMSLYCQQADGRKRLLERIYKRFEYIAAFPELYRAATKFHRELSTLFYFQTIVTTNWDDYFERECAAAPLVTGQDLLFAELPERKVIKLHGSINNIGSIVATEEDYGAAENSLQHGTLGGTLKTLLATHTILYAGYSLKDSDLLNINRYIRNELGPLAPTAYIVSVDRSSRERFEGLGLRPIFTDASHFLAIVKRHLLHDGHLLADSVFDRVESALARIGMEHDRLHDEFDPQDTPMMIYAAVYQDGLLHALERVTARWKTGEYSHRCRVVQKIQQYERIKNLHMSRHRYLDAAYAQGYSNGLWWLVMDTKARAALPYYFNFGPTTEEREISTVSSYRRIMRARLQVHHRGALKLAKQVVGKLGPGEVLHHQPFLATE